MTTEAADPVAVFCAAAEARGLKVFRTESVGAYVVFTDPDRVIIAVGRSDDGRYVTVFQPGRHQADQRHLGPEMGPVLLAEFAP